MVIGQALTEISALFEQNGVLSPDYEARQLLMQTLGFSAAELLLKRVDEADCTEALKLAQKRITGVPLQYLLGQCEFYGLPFKVGEGVLIPRPETELLADLAAERLTASDCLLDLCSGSGCIPIAATKTVGCKAIGVELHDRAYRYFTENIALNKAESLVKPIQGDILSPEKLDLNSKFRLITSNPPYLTAEEMEILQREVTYEPQTALFGGEDGLDFYRRLFGLYKPYLEQDGLIAVEVGDKQHEAVMSLAEQAGLKADYIPDYNKIPRVVTARLS